MCFYNAMSLQDVKLAARYGRKMDVIEAWKQVMAEKAPSNIATLPDIYKYRLAERMYCIPAYSQPHCVIVSGSSELEVMDWGLIPRRTKPDKKDFYNAQNWHKNARAEDIFTKWPWKFLIRSRRCIIPSTGYFEYHYGTDGKTQPYFIYLTGREVFSMAGLWDEWEDPATGEKLKTFVQITTAANPFTRRIHNGGRNPYRMPLILQPEDEERWLDESLSDREIESLLKVYPAEGMAAYPVYKGFRDLDPYDERLINEDREARQGALDLEEQ